jgi:hypothetical protein
MELLTTMIRSANFVNGVLALLLATACVPDFTDDTSRIGGPRILAVRSHPAEARDGEQIVLEALVAAAESESPELAWSRCIDRKPLSELGPVSPRCLASPEPVPEITERVEGTGATVTTALPGDACRLFGPELPEPKPGEPSGRPVDPDPTGGFYQPFIAWLDDAAVLASTRIACRIRDVGFSSRYRKNENPAPTAFEARRRDGSVLVLGGTDAVALDPGERIALRVGWPSCPASDECGDGVCGPDETALPEDTAPAGQTSCAADCATPQGCGGAERYAVFDLGSQQTHLATETLSVSWYATDGSFDGPRTDGLRALPGSGEPGSENAWTAPRGPGRVRLWAVVRDDRGGVSWVSGDVTTEG